MNDSVAKGSSYLRKRDRSHAHGFGLRAKFNAVLVPVIATAIGLLVVLDYRHEFEAVMDAHAIHTTAGETSRVTAPVGLQTTPEAVVRRMTVLHVTAGALTLLALVIAVNATLSHYVLTPIDRVRAGIERLQRGFRTGERVADSGDEVGEVVAAFTSLGLALDALMLHSLHTDRLATLALLSKMIAADVEPEVQRLGVTATRLHEVADEDIKEAAREVAGATARILAALRRLDRPFVANGRKSLTGTDVLLGDLPMGGP